MPPPGIGVTDLDPGLGYVDPQWDRYLSGHLLDLEAVGGRDLDQLAEQTFNISRQPEIPIYDLAIDGGMVHHHTYESDSQLRRRILRVISDPASYPPGSVARTLASGQELPWLVAKIKPQEPKILSRWEWLLDPIL
jgi:hypothetical protein